MKLINLLKKKEKTHISTNTSGKTINSKPSRHKKRVKNRQPLVFVNSIAQMKHNRLQRELEREEERRRREEERRRKQEEEKRQQRRSLIALGAMALFGMLITGIGTLLENQKPSDTVTSTSTATNDRQTDVVHNSNSESINHSERDNTSYSATNHSESTHTSPEPTQELTNKTVDGSEAETNPFHVIHIDDLDISIYTDYGHISNSVITLGNNEAFTININTKNTDMTEDDIIIWDEDEVFTYLSVEKISDGYYRYRMQTNTEGYHHFWIFTGYDLYKYGENASGYNYEVCKLNWRDGQIVYVSSTGEKYHKTAKHAGEYYQAITLLDAEALGYEPCSICY